MGGRCGVMGKGWGDEANMHRFTVWEKMRFQENRGDTLWNGGSKFSSLILAECVF